MSMPYLTVAPREGFPKQYAKGWEMYHLPMAPREGLPKRHAEVYFTPEQASRINEYAEMIIPLRLHEIVNCDICASAYYFPGPDVRKAHQASGLHINQTHYWFTWRACGLNEDTVRLPILDLLKSFGLYKPPCEIPRNPPPKSHWSKRGLLNQAAALAAAAARATDQAAA